jgi:hypothetical protein
MIKADLDPREDDADAWTALRAKAQGQLIAALAAGHPNNVRAPMTDLPAAKEPAKLAAPATPATNGDAQKTVAARRGRPTNAELEAKRKAEADAKAQLGADETGNALGEQEAQLGGEDTASMLGDEVPAEGPAVTYDQLKAALSKLANAQGAPALQKLFRKFGATTIKDLKPEAYGEAFKHAAELLSAVA